MLFDPPGNKTKQNQRKLKEITLRMEALNQEIDAFFKEVGVSVEEFAKYASNSDNFTPQAWSEMEKRRKFLDERLQKELDSIQDPSRTKKSFDDHSASRNWIPCR